MNFANTYLNLLTGLWKDDAQEWNVAREPCLNYRKVVLPSLALPTGFTGGKVKIKDFSKKEGNILTVDLLVPHLEEIDDKSSLIRLVTLEIYTQNDLKIKLGRIKLSTLISRTCLYSSLHELRASEDARKQR